MPADGARVRVGGAQGTRGVGEGVGRALVVQVAHVERDARALHEPEHLGALLAQVLVRVVAAREGAGRVPAEGCHDEAVRGELLDEPGVRGKEARVLDRADGRDVAPFERARDFVGRARSFDLRVSCQLIAHISRDVRLEGYCLLGRELVGDKAREALRPRRGADLLERDVAMAVREVAAAGGVCLVAGPVEVVAVSRAQLGGEALPRDAVGSVAMQVEHGDGRGAGIGVGWRHVFSLGRVGVIVAPLARRQKGREVCLHMPRVRAPCVRLAHGNPRPSVKSHGNPGASVPKVRCFGDRATDGRGFRERFTDPPGFPCRITDPPAFS